VKAADLAMTFQSMNSFLNWFKLVSYLARYPVFALMTRTLEHAFDELSAFAVVFAIVMFGFAQAHSMFFGKYLANYETISTSFLTLFRAMLGDFNFAETYYVHYVIGPLYFITFVGIAFLVVLNIIIAIIADAYVDANQWRKAILKKKKAKKDALARDRRNSTHEKVSRVSKTMFLSKKIIGKLRRRIMKSTAARVQSSVHPDIRFIHPRPPRHSQVQEPTHPNDEEVAPSTPIHGFKVGDVGDALVAAHTEGRERPADTASRPATDAEIGAFPEFLDDDAFDDEEGDSEL
jgi:hypothetical protein